MAQRNSPAKQQGNPASENEQTSEGQGPGTEGTADQGATQQPPAAAAAPPEQPAAAPERAPSLRVALPTELIARMKDNDGRSLREVGGNAAELLAEACFVLGINPDPSKKPLELAAWKYYPGDPDAAVPEPASVTIVTAGGWKGRYPIDDDTEHKLRIALHAYRVNRATGERELLPLPENLTLPGPLVDGIVRTEEHQYREGYLRAGGREEAARRAKIRELRDQGRIR